MDRPGWEDLVKQLEPGDVLVIHSIDRLSRNLVDTMTTLDMLHKRGVRVKVLTMDFDSRTPMGRFVFSMLSAFSQFERDVIHERTMHGLAKARERGVMGGSKMKWSVEAVVAAVKAHGSYKNAAAKLGCKEITVKRKMAEAKEKGLV